MSDKTEVTEAIEPPAEPAASAPAAKIKVRIYAEPEQLRKDASINDLDITGAMMSQTGFFIHYGVEAARAKKQVADLKLLKKVSEAKIAKLMREAAVKKGEKAPSEAQITRDVPLHPTIVRLERAIAEAEMIAAIGETAREAFKQRRDMLIQIGADQRGERAGEIRTMARREADAELDRRAIAAATPKSA